jgi:hypothetical protein
MSCRRVEYHVGALIKEAQCTQERPVIGLPESRRIRRDHWSSEHDRQCNIGGGQYEYHKEHAAHGKVMSVNPLKLTQDEPIADGHTRTRLWSSHSDDKMESKRI